IRVATGVQGDRVVVTISDNGKGFLLPQALNGNGKGLSNQMRRAQAIGAEINWETSEKGTTLTLSLPIVWPSATA
ncbi:MAG: sensor histidine kinase, partial [Hylemonella sp.]|nr:sensor histidine kinase [Hylemonella sp.]